MKMETLLKILGELHQDIDFTTCDTLVKDGIIDSFDIIAIVSEIDDKFGVAIPPEEIIPDNFNSAHALYALIDRLANGF